LLQDWLTDPGIQVILRKVFFEDARDLTTAAVQLLQSQKYDLARPDLKIWSLSEFSKYVASDTLSRSEKQTIVEQAIILIDQFYAHLPFKRARYAVNPVQSLRLIQAQLEQLTDLAFHDRMVRALTGLRDAHTFYALPQPYKGALAFLPFRLRCFQEKTGNRRFIVTDILDGFDHPGFNVRAEILSWNGVPIDQAVEREGQFDPGGNPASQFARGVSRMTSRSLTVSVPPLEEFVVLEYLPATGPAERRGIVLPWFIAANCLVYKSRWGANSSINESMADVAQGSLMLFHRSGMIGQTKQPPAPNSAPSGADFRHESHYPQVFAFQYSGGVGQPGGIDPATLHDAAHPHEKFGYIRIKTFDLDPADPNASDKFVQEFQRIAALMQGVAPDGLVIDVRSNPGGAIDAAERILQFLTPRGIQPANFHFITSPLTQQIASDLFHAGSNTVSSENQREWAPWINDLMNSVSSGGVVTHGFPLTEPEQANDTGQIYQGPVLLIVDALAYSATDIFAAGFQDHQIGTVVGVDENTGGGGANRWLHEELMQNLHVHGLHNHPLKKLPREAQLGLAIRRSTRVSRNAGTVLEDLGVKADVRHNVTRRDLLQNDHDLLAFACAQLAAAPTYLLAIEKAALTADGVEVSVRTRNLFRVECMVNGLPQCSFPAKVKTFLVPVTGLIDPPESLTLNGFAKTHDTIRGTQLEFVVTATADLPASRGAASPK
jgi:hypothetical protein